jgi:hypothetical protein
VAFKKSEAFLLQFSVDRCDDSISVDRCDGSKFLPKMGFSRRTKRACELGHRLAWNVEHLWGSPYFCVVDGEDGVT